MSLKSLDGDWAYCPFFFPLVFATLSIFSARGLTFPSALCKQNNCAVTLCGRSCRRGGGLKATSGWWQLDYLGRAACRPRSARSACLRPLPAPGCCTAPRPLRCSRRCRSRPTPSTSGSCSGCRGRTPRSAERETVESGGGGRSTNTAAAVTVTRNDL